MCARKGYVNICWQIVLYVGGGICKGGEMLESFLLCFNLRPLFCLAVCHALQKILLVPGFFPLARILSQFTSLQVIIAYGFYGTTAE
jgi:hypothetical protein